jgi:hypothetical protein
MEQVVIYGNVTWISDQVLTKYCGINPQYLGTTARPRYKQSLPAGQLPNPTPDTGAAWRFAKFNGSYYYDLNRIPDKEPARYRSMIPPIEELLKADTTPDMLHDQLIERIRKALDYDYQNWTHKYVSCPKRENLARAAACLATIAEIYIDFPHRPALVGQAIEVCRIMSVPYLPTGTRRMKERLEAFLAGEDITSLVFLPRAGNQNALRLDDPDIISWMVKLRAMKQNYTHIHIIRIIEKMCAMYDKECPSQSWFYSQLCDERIKFLTSTRWGGKGRHGNPHTGYTPIADPLFAGDVWQIDGTRVNLIDHLGPDGRQQFLYVIALRDGHSGDVLGVHFDTKEDRWGYFNVLKMAVAQAGYLPYELVIDRFPGHNTDEWKEMERRMKMYGTKVTYTSAATGKAQIERWFGTLQTVFMQGSKYYYGEGVRSSREYAHRTAEYLMHMRREARVEGWDFDAAWQEGMRVINAYRNTPYSAYSRKRRSIESTPMELHQAGEKPNAIQVAVWQYADLFGMETTVNIRRHGMIKIDVMRLEYHYRVMDEKVIQNFKSVTVVYELDDLSRIYLFSADDRRDYLGEAVEQRAVMVHGPQADMEGLATSKAQVKRVEAYREAALLEMVEAGDNEVDLLMEGLLSKGDKESSETAYLLERVQDWQDHGQPRIPAAQDSLDDDDDEQITANVRNLY